VVKPGVGCRLVCGSESSVALRRVVEHNARRSDAGAARGVGPTRGVGMTHVGPTWVHEVGKLTLGDKNISFLAETLSKLRFYRSTTLATTLIR
jgi:hypothetical protein